VLEFPTPHWMSHWIKYDTAFPGIDSPDHGPTIIQGWAGASPIW